MRIFNRFTFLKIYQEVFNHPSLVFLVISVIFGIIFIFTLAPLNGKDEFTHFPRAYLISEGTFWEERLPNNQYGGALPINISRMTDEYRNLSRASNRGQYVINKSQLFHSYNSNSNLGKPKVKAIFTSDATYPPWDYVPSVIGIIFAKILHLPLIWYVYIARIFSLFLWASLTYMAIRIIPSGKWFLVALGLLPSSLTQAATISADGILNGLSWLVIALTLSVIARRYVLSIPKLLLISFLMLYLALIKDGYWLIAVMPLIIPASLLPKKINPIIYKVTTLLVLICASVWFFLKTAKTVSGIVLTPTQGVYVNSNQQIHYVLHHLILFISRTLWLPFTKAFDTIYLSMVGVLTNRLVYLSILVMFLLFFGLYLALSQTKQILALIQYRRRVVLSALIVIVGTYLLIGLALYVGNSQVGGSIINALDGRYYLPLAPLLLVFPMTLKHRVPYSDQLGKIIITAISLIGLISTVTSVG